MRTLLILFLSFSFVSAIAQVKGQNPSVSEKKRIDSINYTHKKSKSDTIRITVPKDNKFNPSNAKIKNSKIKTPVYDNTLKGTGMPGDANTGIPANTNKNTPLTPAAERVKKARDSANNKPAGTRSPN